MRAVLALFSVVDAGRLDGQASPRGVESRSFLIGPSVMIDRMTHHFDPRPRGIGVEAEYLLYRGPGLGGGLVSVAARAHYWSTWSLAAEGPVHGVTSVAAGLVYHPIPDIRLDPYAGVMLRFRRGDLRGSDSTRNGPLVDAGARWRLARRTFVQAGMSFADFRTFGLWRGALLFNF